MGGEILLINDINSANFIIRGQKVMTDTDLASLYGTETKILKQQVKRNIERFPKDFMFILTRSEKVQLVTICDRLQNLKHSSVSPMVFTEQGVAMLSSVLRSKKAIAVNIEIMRAFARYRALLKDDRDLRKELSKMDGKINKVFKYLLLRIDALQTVKSKKVNKIGYKDFQKDQPG